MLTCFDMKILSQSSQQVILSPSPKAIVLTADLVSEPGFLEAAGPGLGLLFGPGFLLVVVTAATEGDESLEFLPDFSESLAALMLDFRTFASSTDEDSLDFRALAFTDAGISLLRLFLASSNAESSPKWQN